MILQPKNIRLLMRFLVALPKGYGKLMIYRGGFETLVICKSITVNTKFKKNLSQ